MYKKEELIKRIAATKRGFIISDEVQESIDESVMNVIAHATEEDYEGFEEYGFESGDEMISWHAEYDAIIDLVNSGSLLQEVELSQEFSAALELVWADLHGGPIRKDDAISEWPVLKDILEESKKSAYETARDLLRKEAEDWNEATIEKHIGKNIAREANIG